jgi:beta-N-acetylhexosaminidase
VSRELERLAAATLLPGFVGLEPPDWIRRRLGLGLGGVVLYSRNVRDLEQLRRLTDELRRERADVIVAIDEEGGDVTRLEADRGSSYPGNAALGHVDDVQLTRAVALAMGSELARAGVNLDLAPVADVNTNPDNPVIGIRSFGSDGERVSRHVAAFVEGLQAAGVAACAKHFPGHGDTVTDSHLDLPTVPGLEQEALLPFSAAVDAGARAIMTAHIRVEAVGDDPATINGAILGELLRGELGFSGAVITDALEMRAISATIGVEEGAVRALAAGADALCLGHDLGEEATDRLGAQIVAAVRDGRLREERLAEAAAHVSEIALWASEAPREEIPGVRVGHAAAQRALETHGPVPALGGQSMIVELRPEPSIAVGPQPYGLGDAVRSRLPSVDVVRFASGAPDGLQDAVATHDQVVLVVQDAHRHAWQREAVEALSDRRTVVVETGIPVWRPKDVGAYIATHGSGRVNLEAAAELLASQTS